MIYRFRARDFHFRESCGLLPGSRVALHKLRRRFPEPDIIDPAADDAIAIVGTDLDREAAAAQLLRRGDLAAAAAERLGAEPAAAGTLPHRNGKALTRLAGWMICLLTDWHGRDLPHRRRKIFGVTRRLIRPHPPEEARLVLPAIPGPRQ